MRTVEIRNADGTVVAQAEIDDGVNVARMMGKLDRQRARRSRLAQALRDHIVTARSGGIITCACGTEVPTANAWAAHTATAILPPPT